MWQDLRAGLRYVWAWPGLMMLLLMATVLNFLYNPAGTLTPLLVTKHFGGQALELGWMNSAWGVGAVIGGLLLGVWVGFRRRIITSMVGLTGMGLGSLMIGAAPATAFWLALAGMFVFGFMNPITNGPLFAIVQSTVAPDMQGRVMSLIGSLSAAMSPLSLIVAGPLADALGVRVWYWIAGGVTLLMVVIALLTPAIMNIERKREAESPAETLQPVTPGVLDADSPVI
jgi:DHA3 family macrolide efflux protein-like MFS transporter